MREETEMAKGREGHYDFVKGHDAGCNSEFDADYYQFDPGNCKACAAHVAQLKSELEEIRANKPAPGTELFPGLFMPEDEDDFERKTR